MGRDTAEYAEIIQRGKFQSTLPAWGETLSVPAFRTTVEFQSTLPAWGETEKPGKQRACPADFNPLSPHGERPRRRGATTTPHTISIHSPRMVRDAGRRHAGQRGADFNPLSPHGERRNNYNFNRYMDNFNPLSPHGERPTGVRWAESARRISIHSPHMGRDQSASAGLEYPGNFNPLSPHGERHERLPSVYARRHFNPLSPHGERPL